MTKCRRVRGRLQQSLPPASGAGGGAGGERDEAVDFDRVSGLDFEGLPRFPVRNLAGEWLEKVRKKKPRAMCARGFTVPR